MDRLIENIKMFVPKTDNEEYIHGLAIMAAERIPGAIKKNLTPPQKLTYDKLAEYIAANGYSPTVRELCALCGRRSTGAMSITIDNLVQRGWVVRDKGLNRSLTLI